MPKARMFREPLERYLLSKAWSFSPAVRDVRVVRRETGDVNWEIAALHPALPAFQAVEFRLKVVTPLQGSIHLVE